MHRRLFGIAAALLYVATVVSANWATAHYGFVSVGFGLTATAGTFLAGCALFSRNLVQDAYGRAVVLVLMATGAALSAFTAPAALVAASTAAFVFSELADMTVYTPLRRSGWARAVVPACLVGAFVDTVLFLAIAGFPIWPAVPGQMVGKAWVVFVPVAIVAGLRELQKARKARRAVPDHALGQ
ncbi:VUT family protein [Streptomyces sp. NPDC001635]